MSGFIQQMKVVLVGNTSVGKTCIAKQAIGNNFDENTQPTLGAAYTSLMTNVFDKEVCLQIWDTAGQEKYRSLAPSYYRNSDAIVLVFSLVDFESFNSLDMWISSVKANNSTESLLFLVGNKKDLKDLRQITTEMGTQKAEDNKAFYYEVSAKTGEGVSELFAAIPKYFIEAHTSVADISNTQNLQKKKDSKDGCC